VSDAASPLANLNPSRSEGPIECRDKPSEALQQLGPVYQPFNTLEKKRLTSEVISRIESHQLINLRSLYDVGTSLCNVRGMCSGNPPPRIITRRNHNPGRAKKYFLCPADGPPPSKRKGQPAGKGDKIYSCHRPTRAQQLRLRLGHRTCRRYRGPPAQNEADKDIQYVAVLRRGG
jgi:hypothetical protein